MKKYILINSLSGGGAERVVSSIVNNHPGKFGIITIWPEQDYDIDHKVEHTVLIKKRRNIVIDLLCSIFYLSCFVKDKGINVVNSHLFWSNYVNVLSSLFTKHKTYCTHCVSFLSKFKKISFSYYVHYFLCKSLLTRATGHTFKCNDLLTSYSSLFDFKNCSVIYNPMSVKNNDDKTNFSFSNEVTYLLCVGRFHETKNQEAIIRTLKLLPDDISVIFLGDGPKLDSCKFIAERINVSQRVHFLGHCNNTNYFYSRVPYIISSSLSEGFPNVMIEAISHGCFPISYDCETGPREVSSALYSFDSESYTNFDVYPLGVVFNSPNVLTIAEAIKYTLKNNLEISKDMSMSIVDKLDVDIICNSYYQLGLND